MTIPSDYSFSTTSMAYATLRLWALVQVADDHHTEEVQVHGADAGLEKVLTLWCKNTGRQITFVRGQGTNKDESQIRTTSSQIKRTLPSSISGLGYLALQYFRYFTWHRHRLSSKTADDPALTVVDYFSNLDVEAAQKGTYTSNYWGPLAPIFTQTGKTVNWIHIDVRSAVLPNVRSARAAIRGLNRGKSCSRHVLLQDYLTLRVAFKASAQYLRIRRITKQIATRIPWVDTVSGLDVSSLVRSRLHSDFQGMGAATNALWLSLFEEAFPPRPANDSCLYLMENQPWELALLHARIIQGEGPNVGVAHVTVRNWDLRYALGSAGVITENGETLPAPSRVAVIDPASEAVMIDNGLEPTAIVKVESLRFLSLTSVAAADSNNRAHAFTSQRVLVLGEYDELLCAKQLEFLTELLTLLRGRYAFTFRPSPASQILERTLPDGVSPSEGLSLGADLARCDVVLCGNVSSAPLNASWRGIPILMARDGRGLNGSLLIAGPSVTYVNSAAEVIAALEELKSSGKPRNLEQRNPMYLDSGLTRWRLLLDSLFGHEST
jgi:surface carbohydrate biosynthesis protein (TIGR04326 family)